MFGVYELSEQDFREKQPTVIKLPYFDTLT